MSDQEKVKLKRYKDSFCWLYKQISHVSTNCSRRKYIVDLKELVNLSKEHGKAKSMNTLVSLGVQKEILGSKERKNKMLENKHKSTRP